MDKRFKIFILVLVGITSLIYVNHFDNGFHFDDSHTILENPHIRSLRNIPNFFTDGTTMSSLPQNQSYRPVITTSLAIDYWLGSGYHAYAFHAITFLLFLILGVLYFLFLKKIAEKIELKQFVFYWAASIAIWFMVHPAMAETVNYIIARSDLYSTLFVVLAFVLYLYLPKSKQYHLYLIPIVVGALSKPLAIMFAPLLFFYILLFEENQSLYRLDTKASLANLQNAARKTLPSFLVCIALFALQHYMTPDTFETGGTDRFRYLITQPFVLLYYFGTAFLPINLSADTDWGLLGSIWSGQFFVGISFVISIILLIIYASQRQSWRGISFGMLWFCIALAPTSSIIPLAEVMNDHRMFFPYIGLLLAIGNAIWLGITALQKKYPIQNYQIICGIGVLLLLYGFGTLKRNQVWDTEESLWKDVTLKSPKNGRGLMNYGLSQMHKGKYAIAESYFNKAKPYIPNYHTLYINLGVLHQAQGKNTQAENNYKKAIALRSDSHTPWFYYGRFLSGVGRKQEAVAKLKKANAISPYHMPTRQLLMENYLDLEQWDHLKKEAYSTLEIEKDNKKAQLFMLASVQKIGRLAMEERQIAEQPSAQQYLNLSLKYFENKRYAKCISMANKALTYQPKMAEAYNNICSAYNLLGNFDKAKEACQKALTLNPKFVLAKNNLMDIEKRVSTVQKLVRVAQETQSLPSYLDISLLYYNYMLYEDCIRISEEALEKFPNADKLYNNICAAHNSQKHWEKAIVAAQKGLEINPKNQLLKNNYNWALKKRNENQQTHIVEK